MVHFVGNCVGTSNLRSKQNRFLRKGHLLPRSAILGTLPGIGIPRQGEQRGDIITIIIYKFIHLRENKSKSLTDFDAFLNPLRL